MESMILGRQQNFALICAIFVVSAIASAALAETITTVVTDDFSTGNPSSTITAPMSADTAPLSTAAMLNTSAVKDTTTSTDGPTSAAFTTTAESLTTTVIEATTTSIASNSANGSASTNFTTADKSLAAVTATLPNATESPTNMSTASASDGITNGNASSVAATTTSITSSQGTSSTSISIPANGTDSSRTESSRTDGSATPASSSLSPTMSPEGTLTSPETTLTSPEATTTSPEASSSSAYYTKTSAAVESTAASTTVQSTLTNTVGNSALPMTQIIIISVSSAVGGILVIIIIIGVVVHCRRQPRRRPAHSRPTDIPSPPIKAPTRSRIVNLADFAEYVNQLSADSDYGFAEEFEELEDAGTDQPITAAREERNLSKNRYSNVLPHDHSRVKLHTSLVSQKSDYVNANYIPGHNGPKEFIATQGPLLVTADDFWQMVWEQQCKAIVMLTRCTEGLVDKCYHYWPSGHDPVVYGDVTIQVTDELEQPQWTVTNFSVSRSAKAHPDNADTQQLAGVRHVRHFHFTTFPDHRSPEIESMLHFVRMVRSKLQPAATGGSGPVIVHCSAGVGRTGTFIAIDRLLQQIDEGRTSVDVFGIIREMRMHRMFMVQTEEQYIFIYKIILHELQKKRNSVSLNGGTDNKAFEVLRCWWHRALTAAAAADESERSVDRRCCSILC